MKKTEHNGPSGQKIIDKVAITNRSGLSTRTVQPPQPWLTTVVSTQPTSLAIQVSNYLQCRSIDFRIGQVSHAHYQFLCSAFDCLTTALGNPALPKVSSGQLQQALIQHGGGLAGQLKLYWAWKPFFAWVGKKGCLPVGAANPMDSVQPPAYHRPPVIIRPWTFVSDLLRFASQGPADLPAVALAAFAGLLPRQLLRLQWHEITPAASIFVHGSSRLPIGHIVPMDPVLDAWLSPFYGSSGPIIHSPSRLERIRFKAQQAGLGFRWHELRNSFLAHAIHTWSAAKFLSVQRDFLPNLHVHTSPSFADAQQYFNLEPAACGQSCWQAIVRSHLGRCVSGGNIDLTFLPTGRTHSWS